MIVKGGSVGGGGLAAHLESDENESVDLVSAEALLSADVAGAVRELRGMAAGVSAKGIFHFQISPGLGETWGPDEEAKAVKAVIDEYGLQGQPIQVVRHAKDAQQVGRSAHLHIVALRVQPTGKVISDSYTRVRNEKISRALEHDLGHACVPGRHNRAVLSRLRAEGRSDVAEWMKGAAEGVRPEAARSFAEHQKEKRTGVKKVDVAAATLAAWRASDCGVAFAAAMAEKGFHLAQGREAGIMVVDTAGGSHDLTRLLRAALKAEGDKLPAKEVRAQIDGKLADLDPASLPPLAEVVAGVREGTTPAPAVAAVAPEIDAAPAEVPTAAAILNGLVREKATFSESDLDKALRGIAEKPARAALKAEILSRPDLLTVALDADGERRMTTIDMLKVEAGILDRAEALTGGRRFAVAAGDVDTGIAAYMADFKESTGFDLAAEQTGGIRHITAGADFTRVTGVAGAGKTTLLTGAARIWDGAGYRVEGMALSGVAAARLGESGIKSDTIAARLMAWDRLASLAELRHSKTFSDDSRQAVLRSLDGWKEAATARGENTARIESMRQQVAGADRLDQLDRPARRWLSGWLTRQAAKDIDARTVLVVDEAGMVNHRLFSRILAHAERVGAKVVAVGDAEQIQPIEAGAAFRVLEKITPAWRLDEVVRQKEAWQRQATKDLAAGDSARAGAAVRAYAAHGDVMTGIWGTGNRDVIYAEAAKALGRDIDAADRAQIDRVAGYVGARVEAGSLWREIEAAGGKPEQHPLYDQFRAAQERRGTAVQALAADLDAARPWLARYGVDGEGFAADLGYAQGIPRAMAQALAADKAEALGLAELEPDIKLSFDWRGAARQELFQDWKADLARDGMAASRIILAYTRADVARLNADARATMRDGGHLTGPDVAIASEIDGEAGRLALAIGDRVMTLANDKKIGVMNGTTGRVVAIEPQDDGAAVLTVATDDGRTVRIDTSTYKAIQHGYAATLHKSQGVTVDRAWMLSHGLIDRHLAYVGLSRHRESVKVSASAIDAATLDALARQYGKGRTKDAISDYVDARALLRQPAAVRADIRQVIGEAATIVRATGQRLDAALTTAARTTHSSQQKKEMTYARPRPIADAFGLPRALRQLDADATAPGATARSADLLSAVQRQPLARHAGRGALLLPRDAASQLDQQGARSADAVRRSGLRGRAVDPLHITGENTMPAIKSARPSGETDSPDLPPPISPERPEEENDGIAFATLPPLADPLVIGEKLAPDASSAEKLRHQYLQMLCEWYERPFDARFDQDIRDAQIGLGRNNDEVEINFRDGSVLRDSGKAIILDSKATPEKADLIIALAAAKGMDKVFIKGSEDFRKALVKACYEHGIEIQNSNSKLDSYLVMLKERFPERAGIHRRDADDGLTLRAAELDADRAALAEARRQPDLADPEKFTAALTRYEKALVIGEAPAEELRAMKSNLMARGEALQASGDPAAADWAEEARRTEQAKVATAVCRA